ncbi:GntR family transcriptional regulator [Brevibacillus sp. RS1.1]|uniref:GntR family transcriptional regulator n=1 Tax=Brevibacillus TaxID=55080 RepID=UPI00156BA976|nr:MULTISPECIES: GntR family transcriptional regulator [Brevibacillus]MBH0333819.1 transcriptional regulator [Brevibacillus brevis]NRR02429.1 GntR family transcriptional regulator [Brevibacillus sp. RS1.1]
MTQSLVRLNADFPIPIHVQIKEQLKLLIGVGHLQPGEMLPPASQLADQLQVNRNTINAVYTQLRDEGLVYMQKGRGTSIADKPAITAFRMRQQSLYDHAKTIMTEAQQLPFSLDELMLASIAYGHLFLSRSKKESRWLLVECHEHDHPFYRKKIEEIIGHPIQVAYLENHSDVLSALQDADQIVTTVNHAEEVKELAARYHKSALIIGANAQTSTLLEIARLEAGRAVGFVCLGKKGGEWMAGRVQEAGIEQIQHMTAGFADERSLQQIIHDSDLLYASAAVYDQLLALAPDKTRLYPMLLEQSSEALLKEASNLLAP